MEIKTLEVKRSITLEGLKIRTLLDAMNEVLQEIAKPNEGYEPVYIQIRKNTYDGSFEFTLKYEQVRS